MKKIVLSVMLLVMVIIACVALVGCDNTCTCTNCNGISNTETREVLVTYNYSLTSQYTRIDGFIIGELAYKPQDPKFINHVFYGGLGKTGTSAEGINISTVGKDPISIENPRMNDGYDANLDYYFVGWYKEPEFISLWNFAEDRVYENTNLYAKWTVKTW